MLTNAETLLIGPLANFNRNLYISIQENASENVVWKMASILSRPQCVQDNVSMSNGKSSFRKQGDHDSELT